MIRTRHAQQSTALPAAVGPVASDAESDHLELFA